MADREGYDAMVLMAVAITFMLVLPVFLSSEEDAEMTESEDDLPEESESEHQAAPDAFSLLNEDEGDSSRFNHNVRPKFEEEGNFEDLNGTVGPTDEATITTNRELTDAGSEGVFRINSYFNRYYLSGGDDIVGSDSNETFFFRGNILEGESNSATGSGGEDAFVLEFGDTNDPLGSMNYVEDFEDETDKIGATFHDTIDYDHEEDKILEVSHYVDNVQGYLTDEGFRIDVSFKQIRTVEIASGDEQSSETILTKSMVLRGVEDYDISKLSISNDWRIFVH